MKVAVIGAGLAGSEAALILARRGISVDLYEMRPLQMTPAHETSRPAELVCSNSFKSDELPTAHGLLKHELKKLQSPLMDIASASRVPAGSALAVNRQQFSELVEQAIQASPLINYRVEECEEPPLDADYTIIATGPLTSEKMSEWLQTRFSAQSLNFYDAIAPIIDRDTIDMDRVFYASRWEKGGADYLNCPFTREEYDRFYDALVTADRLRARDFEDATFFEACLPVEVVAGRGYDSLRFSMMKPVGLRHPQTGKQYFAVCQLRKENLAGTAFNMVGFQTRMTMSEQHRVFRLIPGLENAEFVRYGTIHRNTYLNSPDLLQEDLSFCDAPNLFLAGQLCGNEGYTESVATGHLAALAVLSRIERGGSFCAPRQSTALGALIRHVTTRISGVRFVPSNINFSLISPPADGIRLKKNDKKEYYCCRAIEELDEWVLAQASF